MARAHISEHGNSTVRGGRLGNAPASVSARNPTRLEGAPRNRRERRDIRSASGSANTSAPASDRARMTPSSVMPDPSANARLSSFTATAMPVVESVLLETPRDQLESELIRRREPAGDIYAFHSKRIIAPVHQSAVRGKTAA